MNAFAPGWFRLVILGAASWPLLVACVGTTGAEIVDFDAAAAGPRDAVAGEPLAFATDRGFDVVLTTATLHVGAMYLDQAIPVSGAQSASCILPGTYVAQVTNGIDLDLLDPEPHEFPGGGHGTTLEARAGQVWLTHDDVNSPEDPSGLPVLDVEGTVKVEGQDRSFSGQLSISNNRQPSGTTLAGSSPICKQRIVSPVPTLVSVETAGGLLLRVDPRLLFVNVDFATLTRSGDVYTFSDDPTSDAYSQASVNLYANLHSGGTLGHASLYTFSWQPRL